jgi:beta-galactosidase
VELTVAFLASGGPQPDARPGRLEQSFDEGWLFYRGDASGAEQVSFDDSNWRALDLPHDWSIEDLPDASTTDAGVTAHPSRLVPQVRPTQPAPPPVIGPFDVSNSAGDRPARLVPRRPGAPGRVPRRPAGPRAIRGPNFR